MADKKDNRSSAAGDSQKTRKEAGSSGYAGDAPRGGKESYSRRYRYYWRSRRYDERDPSLVKRYFPVFENLVLFLLDSKRWIRYSGLYFKEEIRRKSRLLLQGTVFFVLAAAFLCGAVGMLVIGFYLLFQDLTGSRMAAAFIIAGGSALAAIALLLLMKVSFQRLGRLERYRDEED